MIWIGNVMTPENRKESLKKICIEFGIDILYAFGSRSKDISDLIFRNGSTLSPGPSDVDIGVKLIQGRKLTIKEKILLAIRLEDFLGADRVDLVIISEVDPFLAANIVRGERLFSQNEDLADEYELYILRRAGDLIPLEMERERLIFKEEI